MKEDRVSPTIEESLGIELLPYQKALLKVMTGTGEGKLIVSMPRWSGKSQVMKILEEHGFEIIRAPEGERK
jgi:hypothetical protein